MFTFIYEHTQLHTHTQRYAHGKINMFLARDELWNVIHSTRIRKICWIYLQASLSKTSGLKLLSFRSSPLGSVQLRVLTKKEAVRMYGFLTRLLSCFQFGRISLILTRHPDLKIIDILFHFKVSHQPGWTTFTSWSLNLMSIFPRWHGLKCFKEI